MPSCISARGAPCQRAYPCICDGGFRSTNFETATVKIQLYLVRSVQDTYVLLFWNLLDIVFFSYLRREEEVIIHILGSAKYSTYSMSSTFEWNIQKM